MYENLLHSLDPEFKTTTVLNTRLAELRDAAFAAVKHVGQIGDHDHGYGRPPENPIEDSDCHYCRLQLAALAVLNKEPKR